VTDFTYVKSSVLIVSSDIPVTLPKYSVT